MSRGRKSAPERVTVQARVTGRERLAFEAAAHEAGLSISEWARMALRAAAGMWTGGQKTMATLYIDYTTGHRARLDLTSADPTITLPTEIQQHKDGTATACHSDSGDVSYDDLESLCAAYQIDLRSIPAYGGHHA